MTTDEMCLEALKRKVWVVDEDTGEAYSAQAHRPLGCSNQKGYRVATLHLDGNRKQVKLHRLVWIKVNGTPPVGKVIDHINGRKDDNRIDNLRLASPILNAQNRRNYAGENNPSSKLTKAEVKEIRKQRKKKSYALLSKKYKVSKTLIAKIIRKEIWKN